VTSIARLRSRAPSTAWNALSRAVAATSPRPVGFPKDRRPGQCPAASSHETWNWKLETGVNHMGIRSWKISSATIALLAIMPVANADEPSADEPSADGRGAGGAAEPATDLAALPGAVVQIQNCDGRWEQFVRQSDNALWHRWQSRANDNSSYGPWVSLSGIIIYDPAVAMNHDCRLDVFVITSHHEMFHKWQDHNSPGGWSGWENLGGNLVSSPWTGNFVDGRIWVGAWGPDGIQHFKRQTAPSQGPWIGWY
jgi:hypothetical protein